MKLFYNSHYTEAAAMFPSPTHFTVFQFLLDKLADMEFQARYNKQLARQLEDEPDTVCITFSEFREQCNISKDSIRRVISRLEKMSLVEQINSTRARNAKFKINQGLYHAVVRMFIKLDDDTKTKFIVSFQAGRCENDFGVCPLSSKAIKELEYRLPASVETQFASKGIVETQFAAQPDVKTQFAAQLGDETQIASKLRVQTIFTSNFSIKDWTYHSLSATRLQFAVKTHFASKLDDKTQNASKETVETQIAAQRTPIYQEIDIENLSDEEIVALLIGSLRENTKEFDFEKVIFAILPCFWTCYAPKITPADFIFNPVQFLNDYVEFRAAFFAAISSKVNLICAPLDANCCSTQPVKTQIASKGFCNSMCHSELQAPNKYKEKKEDCVDERSESTYIGEEKEIKGLEPLLNPIGEPSEDSLWEPVSTELNDVPMVNIIDQDKKITNLQKTLNKFSVEEVDEIIEDFGSCLESPAKIFINRFWSALADGLQEASAEDEDFNPDSIVGEAISATYLQQCLVQATEETQDILSNKRFSPDDELLDIPDWELSSEDVKMIMGWKQFTPYKGGSYFQITKDNFYNPQSPIEAPVSSHKHSRRTHTQADRDKRTDDFQYCQKINLIGDTEGGMETLTPIEQFIYHFQDQYLVIDPDTLLATDTKISQIGYQVQDWMTHKLVSLGLDKNDYLQVIFSDRKNSDGGYKVITRMFSADKIRAFNKAHRASSIVDDTKIEDFFEEA